MLNPYHMDGDIEMYSEEQIAARETLKTDPEINKILNEVPLLQSRSHNYTHGLRQKALAK